MRNVAIASAALVLCFSCAQPDPAAAPPSSDSALIAPALVPGVNWVPGSPTCSSLGLGSFAITIGDPSQSGTYNLDAQNTVAFTTSDGVYFDWSAQLAIDAVIVKGGVNSNVYVYSPEAAGDIGLHAPIKAANHRPYAMTSVQFCFDYEVQISTTAVTSFTRTFSWSIDKTGSIADLTLAAGETYLAAHEVTVSVTGYSDSDWAVSGAMTIHNPAPFAATLVTVSDLVDCGVTFPYSLPAFSDLTCSYSEPLPSAGAVSEGAAVSTIGPVGPGDATVTGDFAAAGVQRVDECVSVTDDHAGFLGEVCTSSAPASFQYSVPVGPYPTCGNTQLVSTATAVTADSGTAASDSWAIAVTVPCERGCTLSHGYWKTHSSLGPAPSDGAWALRPQGAGTPFFSTGLTEHQALWAQPRGNAYWILAHQYVAAELNQLNGAAFDDAALAFEIATGLFSMYSPEQIASAPPDLRARFVSAAAALEDYNAGRTGPGPCSE